jgi:choline monooxygenase
MRQDAYMVDSDIRRAETLPAAFYRDPAVWDWMKSELFPTSWQWVETGPYAQQNGEVFPFEYLPGLVPEPLLLVNEEPAGLHCMSNVCTHRGNILQQAPGKLRKLVCGYHGRRFDLQGRMEFMPEFAEALDFPRFCDHLSKIPLKSWRNMPFVSLKPAFDLQPVLDLLEKKVGFLPVEQFRYAPDLCRDYLVNGHWALYCDNYLEGFHIPFVHAGLNQALDYGAYYTELYPYCNVQVGIADSATPVFELPAGHPDHGKRIAAYYFWIFPNLMFNFYPWGLSVNVVKPLNPRQCKVRFILYVHDENLLGEGAGADLDKVEREDEFVVENVQRGLQSQVYQRGRFSPSREQGVHQFHQLLAKAYG